MLTIFEKRSGFALISILIVTMLISLTCSFLVYDQLSAYNFLKLQKKVNQQYLLRKSAINIAQWLSENDLDTKYSVKLPAREALASNKVYKTQFTGSEIIVVFVEEKHAVAKVSMDIGDYLSDRVYDIFIP